VQQHGPRRAGAAGGAVASPVMRARPASAVSSPTPQPPERPQLPLPSSSPESRATHPPCPRCVSLTHARPAFYPSPPPLLSSALVFPTRCSRVPRHPGLLRPRQVRDAEADGRGGHG
jgi:hypothetical protein